MEGLKKGIDSNTGGKARERGEKTPARLMLALKAFREGISKGVTVEGLDNALSIPKDKKVIIATSHITDLDVQLAASALGEHFDLMITNQSTQHTFMGDPMSNTAMRIAGRDNFMPIEYRAGDNNEKSPYFQPSDYAGMSQRMDQGKTMLIAAHNPSRDLQLKRGGYAATYLAQLTDAVILPVGVDMESDGDARVGQAANPLKTLANRPRVTIRIGKPFTPEKIEGVERLGEIMQKRERGEKIDKSELEEFSRINASLKEKSAEIMTHIAQLVPAEKRGDISAES